MCKGVLTGSNLLYVYSERLHPEVVDAHVHTIWGLHTLAGRLCAACINLLLGIRLELRLHSVQ